MSVQAMQWVIEHSQHEGTDFFVLLMLANHAGSDNWECWPSVGLLARECRMSERTIRYALRHLEQGGELFFSRAGGPSGTNLYRLLEVQHLAGGAKFAGGISQQGGGNGRHRRGGHRLPPNHKEPSLKQPSLDISFNTFYEAFPRHQGKGAAKKAYAKALTKASPETILAGATRYRDDPNREPEFSCMPATWLNQERWDDELLPRRKGPEPFRSAATRMAIQLAELEEANASGDMANQVGMEARLGLPGPNDR